MSPKYYIQVDIYIQHKETQLLQAHKTMDPQTSVSDWLNR